MESIIATFHLDWKIIIAQAINFGIVFFVLYFFAIKPLRTLMTERAKKISQGIADASTHKTLLSETKAEYDKVVREARFEAQEILRLGKQDAESEKGKILEQAKAEMSEVVLRGKERLEEERRNMLIEVKKDIVDLAIEATKKILEKEGDVSLDKDLKKHLDMSV